MGSAGRAAPAGAEAAEATRVAAPDAAAAGAAGAAGAAEAIEELGAAEAAALGLEGATAPSAAPVLTDTEQPTNEAINDTANVTTVQGVRSVAGTVGVNVCEVFNFNANSKG